MAWNSTYESRAGLFTLTFVSPANGTKYDYTFSAAISFTQERNLTDTLNKFSLDIVDDGSENFHGLENIVLSGITRIRITYGVGSDNQISWAGFIYDYTSAFFGQKTKLTLIGYITLSYSDNLNDVAGHYYRLDWSPMIPYRIDFKKDWDLFQNSDYVWQRDGSDVEVQKISEETFLAKYEKDYSDTLDYAAERMESFLAAFWDKSLDYYREAADEYYKTGKDTNIVPWFLGDVDLTDLGSITSKQYVYDNLVKARERYKLYEQLYDSYFNRYRKGNFAAGFNIANLKNAVFSPFPTSYPSSRQILMPVPDLFIQWDGIVPGTAYIDGEWRINTDSLLGTLNDVTAFGLKCEMVPGTYSNSDGETNPKVILSGNKDVEGNIRVLKMNNATFICVSDAKALAERRWGKISGNADFTQAVASNNTTSSVSKATLTDNANKIYNYFNSRGYSEAAIAGILGNLECESGIVLNKKEGGSLCTFEQACEDYRNSGVKFGWGLMQWTPPTNIEYDVNGTTAYKKVPGDRNTIEVQCALIEKALSNDYNDPEFMYNYYKGKEDEWNKTYPNNKISFDYPQSQWLSKENFKTCTDVQLTSRAFHLCVERPRVDNSTTEKQQNRALRCSSYLNSIQGFEKSNKEVKISMGVSNTVVPSSWYRTYYNYCLSSYRSALPLQYGGVYISDIVEKLCTIEGWTPHITQTIWSSYEGIQNELLMNGRNALDYIVNVLAPISTSEGTGYTGYVVKLEDKNLYFEPVTPKAPGTVSIRMGYNIPDSPVISFTCKTRGNLIMYGVSEQVSTVTTYSNESSVMQTYTKSESFIESKFSSKSTTQGSNWFSKGLFSYYGFSNTLEGYNSFFSTFYNDTFYYGNKVEYKYVGDKAKKGFVVGALKTLIATGNPVAAVLEGGLAAGIYALKENSKEPGGVFVNASLSDELVRSTPYSSLSETDGSRVLSDLSKFEKASIRAEITIIGDKRITPNSCIEIINMTKRGRHYTSGIYWINKVTDSFSKGSWTQKLDCNRWNNDLDFFNRKSQSTVSKVDASLDAIVDSVINKDVTVEDIDKKLKEFLGES